PDMLAEKWPHLASSQAIFLDTNIPGESLRYLINRCGEEQIPLYIDPVSSAKAKKLPERLDGVDTILPNREEAEILASMEIVTIEDCQEACRRIRERGVKNVIVTLGEQGICFATEQRSEQLSPFAATVADVTGAGDAFAAGFLYGITNSEPFARACQLGLAASALTLQTEHSVSPNLQPEQLYALLD
ncbi:PfkB family carbohydrate kinase, partial [Frankia sp. Cpl3]|nr:PfkB family carbohydrate kinase [Frankia sp. Cpl3]